MIKVVNRREYIGPGERITRPNLLGNPFIIGKDGTRLEVIEKYRHWLWECMNNGSDVGKEVLALARRHLAGENLVLICCCKPERCHGDVIKRAIHWLAEQPPSSRYTL